MRKLVLPVVLGCVLLMNNCGGGQPPAKSKTVVALIFCDVTNSLTKEENRRTGSTAADIIDGLPEGSQFKIYPILIQTQLPAHIPLDVNGISGEDRGDYEVPLHATDVDARKNAEADQKRRETRRQQIQSQLDSLYDQLNKGPDNRSCIINVLGFASNKFRTEYNDEERYELRLYLISDMIEECNVTPLAGNVVEMDKRDISAEIKRASEFKSEWNLSRVSIYCIFPSTRETAGVSFARRPSRDDVKKFWNAMFRGCGLENGAFQNGQVQWRDSSEPLGHPEGAAAASGG